MPDITIACTDTQITPQPVDGVLVRIFDITGATLITQGTTGDAFPGTGEVELTVPSLTQYRAKFSMSVSDSGYAIVSPQVLDVQADGDTFDITVELFQHPAATDPYLCRVSGYITDIAGQPAYDLTINFANTAKPIVVNSSIGILGEKLRILTDSEGYVEFDLYRTGIYRVFVEGLEDIPGRVEVPDRSWTDVNDLLFPIPELLTFTPDTLDLSVDESSCVPLPDVTFRSGLVKEWTDALDSACMSLYVDPDDGGIEFQQANGELCVTANAVGTYDIKAQYNGPLTVNPEPTIGGSLTVTVT